MCIKVNRRLTEKGAFCVGVVVPTSFKDSTGTLAACCFQLLDVDEEQAVPDVDFIADVC